jgi:hypothetical protein
MSMKINFNHFVDFDKKYINKSEENLRGDKK